MMDTSAKRNKAYVIMFCITKYRNQFASRDQNSLWSAAGGDVKIVDDGAKASKKLDIVNSKQ